MPSVLDLIGDTPLVEVTQLDTLPCRLFLKLESANPSGSIKDRPARAMIEAAETDGPLKPFIERPYPEKQVLRRLFAESFA